MTAFTVLAKIGPAEFMTVLIVLLVVVIPVAAIAFSRSGKALEKLGKGTFAIDKEEPAKTGYPPPPPDPDERETEVRQMVEAADYRRRQRGDESLDTDAEVDRLLSGGPPVGVGPADADDGPETPPADSEMDGIREEIRQLVIANNERRDRRGEPPLDVESEVVRRLREWS